jgi:hypothetical protein
MSELTTDECSAICKVTFYHGQYTIISRDKRSVVTTTSSSGLCWKKIETHYDDYEKKKENNTMSPSIPILVPIPQKEVPKFMLDDMIPTIC